MCVQSTTVCDVGLLTHLRLYTLTCRYIRVFRVVSAGGSTRWLCVPVCGYRSLALPNDP